jgi:hypothetical protein
MDKNRNRGRTGEGEHNFADDNGKDKRAATNSSSSVDQALKMLEIIVLKSQPTTLSGVYYFRDNW